jgi:hypothetical protein
LVYALFIVTLGSAYKNRETWRDGRIGSNRQENGITKNKKRKNRTKRTKREKHRDKDT